MVLPWKRGWDRENSIDAIDYFLYIIFSHYYSVINLSWVLTPFVRDPGRT